jgi:putative salt-induced outer membrane protein YdiY
MTGKRGLLRRLRLCGLIALLWSGAAQAIVNIEGMRGDASKSGLSGSLDLSLSGAEGNTDKIATTTSGRLLWQGADANTLLIASYSYGSSNNVRDTNKTFVHLREVLPTSDENSLEGFVQFERNEFTRLSSRKLIGGGVRQLMYDSSAGQFWLGAGTFFSTERLEDDPQYSDGGTERLWRGNMYLAVDYSLNDTIRLVSTTYFQPSLEDINDQRLLEQATLRFSLNDHFALRLKLDIAHDSRPPQSIKKTDVNYLSGLEYSFD